MGDIVVWADIPVIDLDRAMKFYGHVTGIPVAIMPETNNTIAVIGNPAEGPLVSADLYVGGTPSTDGATVYLGTNRDIDAMLERVVEAGGEILQEKQFMGPVVGWIAFIKDTEGNRIGLQMPGAAPA